MTYEDSEIAKLWETILSTDKYRVMIADIADNSARLTGLVEQLLDHVAKS